MQAEYDSSQQRFEMVQNILETYRHLIMECEQAAEGFGDFDVDGPLAHGFM